MSKSSRKLWKAYIHFPYDLTKRHTWEVAMFQYQFICTPTLSSPKLTLDTVPLWSPKNPCTRHVPSVMVDDLALGCQVYPCHAILQRSAKSSADVQVSADVINVFSLDHSHPAFAFMNPAMFRTPVANGVCEFWNDTEIKGKTMCALMCKQQLRSPTWTEKQKGKMKTVHLTAD